MTNEECFLRGMRKSALDGVAGKAVDTVAGIGNNALMLGTGALGVLGGILGHQIGSLRAPDDSDLHIMENRLLEEEYRDKTEELRAYKAKMKKRVGGGQ